MRALLAVLAMAAVASDAGGAPLVAYDDALQGGFEDWSWAVHDLAAASPVHGGSSSLSFEPDSWQAVYLHRNAGIDTALYDGLDLWIHGGAIGGQALRLALRAGTTTVADLDLAPYLPGGALPPAAWVRVHIAFDAAGVGGVLDGFWVQDGSGGDQPAVFLDDIVFSERPPGPTQPVAISVDPGADRHPVSPWIFGVNFGDPADPTEPRYPLRRWGGNSTTRYSWVDDIANRGSDWFFYSIENPDPGTLPDGSTADVFIERTRASGAEVVLTLPTIGWTPIDRNRRWGFSVARYGPQQETECTRTGFPTWCNPDAGNGIDPGGARLTGNDPLDTSRAVGPVFDTDWMAHVAGRVGGAGNGGVRFFALDNEPMLWSETHRDVHPAPLGYDELWQRTLDYATAVKAQDSQALVLGPDSWGWCDYFWSAADGCGNNAGADYLAHGPLLAWYLSQLRDHPGPGGGPLVDFLDVHYYPQAANVALSDDESASTSALRLRSLKGLYDAAYVDESWVGAPVRLIPRLKELVAAHGPPGTRIAITEYSWGNDDGLSSALAETEALAIFAREGVDLATRWVAPARGSRVEDAFRLYLDYDGAGSRVGGESVRAVSGEIDAVGAYAFRDAGLRLFLVLINKATIARTAEVEALLALPPAVAVYGFDAASRLGALPPVAAAGSHLSLDLPPRSVRLLVADLACALPGPAALLRMRKIGATGGVGYTWNDATLASEHVVREDARANGGFAAETGRAASGSPGLVVAAPTPGTRYYLVAGSNACGEGPLR